MVREDCPEEAQKHRIHMKVYVSPLIRKCVVIGCLAVSLSLTGSLQACSVCFGKSDAALAQGLNMGILSLFVLIAMVLSGFIAFFVLLGVRANQHQELDSKVSNAVGMLQKN